jgi:hypothetical protein
MRTMPTHLTQTNLYPQRIPAVIDHVCADLTAAGWR